jgi:hypothetical protein
MRPDPKIVEDWITLQHVGLDEPETELVWPAWDAVYQMTSNDPEMLWVFILTVIKIDASNTVLQNLSAGPLEDLLSQYGEDFIDRVEAKAKENTLFAHLLGGVWQSDMPDQIWSRVNAVWDRRGWDGIPAA